MQPLAREDILELADTIIERWRVDVPPPSETVFEAERDELRTAALSFLEMEREQLATGNGSSWWKLEHEFGGAAAIGRFELPDGRSISVRGRVDRVDRLGDDALVVIDYKTGRPGQFQRSAKKAPFNGGRQLQPALYSAVLQALLSVPVARFEYRFPTGRGEGEIVSYSAEELAQVPELIQQLLEHVEHGHFVPTDDCSDCAYCDYRAVCRSTSDRFGKIATPRAEWAKINGESLDVYRILRAARMSTEPA
jgi:ATP-dependent helicase/nuclease subunit B